MLNVFNPLSVGQTKIVDNIKKTDLPPATTLALRVGR
jgi:hypothetical protein